MPGGGYVAGRFGGEGQRELGRDLAGQLVEHRAERAACVLRQGQAAQPVIPGDPPVGRILGG